MWMDSGGFIVFAVCDYFTIFTLCDGQSKIFERRKIMIDDGFFGKVVQEYERAVIMRLGRILEGRNDRDRN